MAADQLGRARAAAEAAARDAYGRLLGQLVRRTGDLAEAEDALAGAFEAALASWPQAGVPDAPEAWLLTAARRRLTDAGRRSSVRRAAEPALAQLADEAAARETPDWPDARLALMTACARPEIDPAVRAPLMLQVVLGMDAAHIASAFLVKPATMGQRLSRAKARIREAGLSFERPAPEQLAAALEPVLDAIYTAYGAGWDGLGGDDPSAKGLADEAGFLASLAARLAPQSGEAHGLVALIAHCEARAGARRGPDGRFVPLDEQDPARWDDQLVALGEAALRRALACGPPGRFALEAAIQSVHAERRRTGRTNWAAAAALYDALMETGRAGLGAAVARASAHGRAHGAERALEALNSMRAHAVDYQPFHAALAFWLAQSGNAPAAREAYARAAALSADPVVRRYLNARRDAI
ncbi:MAG: RNA polymerase subunit sigma-70 [Alphaproteobacteria bacterium]|nr:RNA polymerase subunit sigma-70 [Alphaproteobacteria bacterium]